MTEERLKEYKNGLEEARSLFKEGRLDEAQAKTDEMIDSLTDDDLMTDDDKYEYYDFKTAIEEGIYRQELMSSKPGDDPDDNRTDEKDKEIKLKDFPISNLYVISGSIAMQKEDYGTALERLDEAMSWNPINPEIAFEYAEVVKRMGSVDQFLELTRRIFPHIYTSRQLAHAYRNVAYYYETKEEDKKAIGSFLFSLSYEEDEMAKKEMSYLMQQVPEEDRQMDISDIRKFLTEDDIQFGPDMSVLKLAHVNGMHFLQEKNYQVAYYFLSIAYDLSRDPKLKELLDKISEELKK